MSAAGLRIAVFVDQVFWRDGDTLSTDEPYALFLASFADGADEVVLIGREAPAPGRSHHALSRPGLSFCALPYYPSLYALWRAGPLLWLKVARRVSSEARNGWDALLVCGPHPLGQLIARLCAARGVPVSLVVRQDLVRQMAAHRQPKRALAMAAARLLEWDFERLARGRAVFAVGAELACRYAARAGHVHDHAPCLVDQGQYRLLSELEEAADPARLLCVGRLAPEKGHDDLLVALSLLLRAGTRCRLDIAGAGPLEGALRAKAAELGLDALLTFHGYVPYGPALFRLYGQAGIFVLPSHTEGMPQVIGEALAAGLPTVATAVGGIPAALVDGETGLLVPPRRPDRIADAIARLLADGALRRRLRQNGRTLMRENTLEVSRERVRRAIGAEVLHAAA